MSISLAHNGLPPGVTHFRLADLIEKIAPGTCREEYLSATAVRVLKHYLLGCRSSDFERGKMCGVWEQPQTTAQTLRISTKVLHNAEAELERGGFIERTHVPHARRTGQRRDGVIVSLAGISLRPIINGYDRWKTRLEAMQLHERAVASLRHEVVMLGREIRATQAACLIEKAERILPRGRVSRISCVEKLEALKGMLEALRRPDKAPVSDGRFLKRVIPAQLGRLLAVFPRLFVRRGRGDGARWRQPFRDESRDAGHPFAKRVRAGKGGRV